MVLILLLSLLFLPASAKLGNSFEANEQQYGKAFNLERFPSKYGYTGYASYNLSQDWRIKAFFKNGKVDSEHLIPRNDRAKLSRDEVRNWAMKMFEPGLRGSYRRKVTQHRVEGHFFDKGLIAYEYFIVDKATQGYKTVKVLFYEKQHSYNSINRKAYL